MFAKLTLRQLIAAGFAVIVTLMFLQYSLSYIGLKAGDDNLTTYQKFNDDSAAIAEMTVALLDLRVSVVKFLKTGDQQSLNIVLDNIGKLDKQSQQAIASTDLAQAKTILQASQQDISQYQMAFDRVAKLFAERHQTVAALDKLGPQIEQQLQQLMQQALLSGDKQQINQVFDAELNLMHGRLFANKYLLRNDAADASEAINMLNKAHNKMASLSAPTANLIEQYQQTVNQLQQLISERNQIIEGTLNTAGPKILRSLQSAATQTHQASEQLL